MWPVTHFPVPAPHNLDAFQPGRLFHGRCDLVVQGPVPAHLVTDPSPQINCVTREVPAVEGLAGPGLNQRLLALWCPETLKHREVHLSDLDGTLNHFHKVRVHASEPLLGAWTEAVHQ